MKLRRPGWRRHAIPRGTGDVLVPASSARSRRIAFSGSRSRRSNRFQMSRVNRSSAGRSIVRTPMHHASDRRGRRRRSRHHVRRRVLGAGAVGPAALSGTLHGTAVRPKHEIAPIVTRIASRARRARRQRNRHFAQRTARALRRARPHRGDRPRRQHGAPREACSLVLG